jgi:hypothetical protein
MNRCKNNFVSSCSSRGAEGTWCIRFEWNHLPNDTVRKDNIIHTSDARPGFLKIEQIVFDYAARPEISYLPNNRIIG